MAFQLHSKEIHAEKFHKIFVEDKSYKIFVEDKSYNVVFSYASSSTLHPRQRVSDSFGLA